MRQSAAEPSFDHAIVLGGSLAGLVAARVLSDHFARVTIVERDEFVEEIAPRKGVPQGKHAHGLLAWGLEKLNGFFPGLREDLIAGGAIAGDMANELLWYQHGAYKVQFQSGMEGLFMTRPFIEGNVRRRVLALPNVRALPSHAVDSLLTTMDHGRVTGVVVRPMTGDAARAWPLVGNMVVDTTGRGSRTPARLERLGYAKPKETEVGVDIGYATRMYRRHAGQQERLQAILVSPVAPAENRIGVMFPVEGDRWILTLGGWHGDHAPTDDAGYLAYARSLPSPDIYNIISHAEPLSDVIVHKLPSSLRRHYVGLRRFPEGFLVLGDAIASFNPVYGQGMTSATLQACQLDQVLAGRRRAATLDGMWKEFFRRAAKVVDIPWQVTVGEDFRFPKTTGKRPPLVDLINRYVQAVQRASSIDPEVFRAFLYVMNLRKAPTSIFAPRVVWRTWKALRGARRSSANPAAALRPQASRA